jgi:hypothetical protein
MTDEMLPLEIIDLMSHPAPSEVQLRREHAFKIDGYRSYLYEQLVAKKLLLREKENVNMLAKGKHLTEMDRKQNLEFHTRLERADVERLEGMIRAIDSRVTLILGDLKFATEEYKRS